MQLEKKTKLYGLRAVSFPMFRLTIRNNVKITCHRDARPVYASMLSILGFQERKTVWKFVEIIPTAPASSIRPSGFCSFMLSDKQRGKRTSVRMNRKRSSRYSEVARVSFETTRLVGNHKKQNNIMEFTRLETGIVLCTVCQ